MNHLDLFKSNTGHNKNVEYGPPVEAGQWGGGLGEGHAPPPRIQHSIHKSSFPTKNDVVTNVSFEDENEGGAVASKADDNGAANAFEYKVINNNYAKQEATGDVALSPTAGYSEIRIHLDTFESCFLSLKAVLDLQNSTKQLLLTCAYLLTPSLNFLGTKKHHRNLIQKHEGYLILFIKN
ncbi:hypothetical protein MAM1_0140c06378 [Mucor ambiguus]|uniref:Uncharacterized protein n=1 Tax=Mucor ambiguus TaxID=91626 RepID=A0A0C9MXH5_9FUNG|nr:hypothetical protein MAM1_0140c06378 [Mucor ambiguus]